MTIHLPSEPVTPCAVEAPNVTFTVAPGVCQPQIGTATSRCSTAWSSNAGERKGLAIDCAGTPVPLTKSSARAATKLLARLACGLLAILELLPAVVERGKALLLPGKLLPDML